MDSLAIGEVKGWDWAHPNHVTVSTGRRGLFTPQFLPRPPSGRPVPTSRWAWN